VRVQFTTPQARPFALRLRSQLATTPLPYQQTQRCHHSCPGGWTSRMVAVATGSEVQLDTTKEEGLSAIKLEDFPAAPPRRNCETDSGSHVAPGLSLCRTLRAVDPLCLRRPGDVRVETQEVFSLGEDRSVLASH